FLQQLIFGPSTTGAMAAGGRRKPGSGWISSLEAVVRESQGTEVDQGRLTATYVGSIFAERRRRREEETGGGETNGRRRELPRFFMPLPASAASGTAPPPPAGSSGSNADTTQTLEESRVAVARSKLRAKARSRFLQRREGYLMGFEDLSDVERALATCVAPAPPPPPPLPPPPEVVADGDNVSNGAKAAALEPGVAAPSGGGGSDDHQAGAAAAAEALSAGGNGTAGVSGSDDDASRGGLTAGTTSSPPPGDDLHAAVDAQGGSADYMDFVRLRGLVSKKAAAACFRSRTFLRFPRDIRARIPSRVFFKHVYESVTLQKTRLTLHFYDSEGLGFLREQDLENYVYDHIPTMPALRAIHDNFYPFYVFTAVRRFMFFLDPKRTGKISIDTLVRSRVMEEFLQVRMAAGEQGEPGSAAAAAAASENGGTQNEDAGAKGGGEATADSSEGGGGSSTTAVGGVGTTESREGAPQGEGGRDDAGNHSPLQDLSKNWFSAESTLKVYGE
ncbi:unnamed protein product, partial [Ectocarpus sp. 4 AP-2014]